MPSTLSLDASMKVYELLGDTYETEKYWVNADVGYGYEGELEMTPSANWNTVGGRPNSHNIEMPEEYRLAEIEDYCAEMERLFQLITPVKAPSFSETVRLLPRIAEKKKWPWVSNCVGKLTLGKVAEDCLWLFMRAPTEEEGMAKVSGYLEKIL